MKSYRYTNSSSNPCILKLSDSHWERTLLPGQTVYFSAPAQSWLDIYSAEWVGCVLSDRIPCCQLEWALSSSAAGSSKEVALLSAA